ncbi:hypothetical protein [Streptomyces sp. NPDC059994]|uniref:hypothetical protein n=1 Tax=Streptomyces sp. NPDC059994 TaxID=3347029 RepID=UPI0036B899BE
MRQRNDTTHAWTFVATPATDTEPETPPYTVEPGGTTDRPELLDGWTALDDEPDAPTDDETAKNAPPLTRRPKKTIADTEDTKGGEPQ